MTKPALTPDEWAAHPNGHLLRQRGEGWAGGEPDNEPLYFPTKLGIAAVNLHDLGYFTHEDVRWLDHVLDLWRQLWDRDLFPDDLKAKYVLLPVAITRRRDLIKALLPPEKQP